MRYCCFCSGLFAYNSALYAANFGTSAIVNDVPREGLGMALLEFDFLIPSSKQYDIITKNKSLV